MPASAPDDPEPVPARTIFFVHIPKTAGSSIRSVLKRWFGARLMIFDSHDREAFAREWSDRRPLAVAGHFGFGLHEAVADCSPVYLSLVRDPVERFVSLYKHARQTPDHLLHPAAGAGLEDFLAHTLADPRARGQTVGIQCFFLTGKRTFEEALPGLRENYAVLAPTDRLAEFVAEAGAQLGRPAAGVPVLNVRPADPQLQEAARRLAGRIREAHIEDQRLHEHVSRCFPAAPCA